MRDISYHNLIFEEYKKDICKETLYSVVKKLYEYFYYDNVNEALIAIKEVFEDNGFDMIVENTTQIKTLAFILNIKLECDDCEKQYINKFMEYCDKCKRVVCTKCYDGENDLPNHFLCK